MNPRQSRLIVASNRLPFVLKQDEQGQIRIQPGSGGLVTALLPVLRDRGGTWVGWTGLAGEIEGQDRLLNEAAARSGYRLRPVTLTREEHDRFYFGFSNEIIWPLFHDLQTLCNFDPDYWQAYAAVNRKFARVIADDAVPDDQVWVQDYQLMLVAAGLRALGNRSRLGFFLHIPFPSPDIFLKLPWRFQILHGLLAYDLIGFQTLRDHRNFIQCLRLLLKDVRIRGRGNGARLTSSGRECQSGVFPIGIDYDTYVRQVQAPAVLKEIARLRQALPDRQLILGIDRLDYTKGIPYRLKAFRHTLMRHPEWHSKVTLIQVVVPSREDIPQYHGLKRDIETLVGEINGQFTRPGGWVPIHYVFRSLSRTELLAYYRAAQIALITPLKDGMNLVAKEYCACSLEEDCVLILSEFAGAAAQLQRGALLVNPADIEGMADALHNACSMPPRERQRRMRLLRRAVRNENVFWWANSFLQAAFSRNLNDFPLPPDYVPREEIEIASV
jgi:trehalose 6-phosphate synthase